MDYKIWFNQALPNAVTRTLKIGRRKYAPTPRRPGAYSNCTPNEMIDALWIFNSPAGPFDDAALHHELDRLMARMRIS